MEKHFVTFYSPGTVVAETTTKPIESWDTEKAVEMSRSIRERYDAKPYAFKFTTRARRDDELDSKVIAESCFYYLGGDVLTIDDIKARKDSKDKILISNMECNGWDRVIENKNSWCWTMPLSETDVVLPY